MKFLAVLGLLAALGLLAGFQGTIPTVLPLTVANGGTGQTTLSAAGIPKLLNAQYNLSPVTATNGADTNIVAYTLPASTASATNSRLEIWYMLAHTSGSTSTTYKFVLGTCTTTILATSTGTGTFGGKVTLVTLGSSSESLVMYKFQTAGNGATGSVSPSACAIDMTANQTLAIAVNQAATEGFTAYDFQVMQVQ